VAARYTSVDRYRFSANFCQKYGILKPLCCVRVNLLNPFFVCTFADRSTSMKNAGMGNGEWTLLKRLCLYLSGQILQIHSPGGSTIYVCRPFDRYTPLRQTLNSFVCRLQSHPISQVFWP